MSVYIFGMKKDICKMVEAYDIESMQEEGVAWCPALAFMNMEVRL